MQLVTTKFTIGRSSNDHDGRMVEIWDTENKANQCVYLHIPIKLLATTDMRYYTKDLPQPTFNEVNSDYVVLGWSFGPVPARMAYLHLCKLVSDESI